MIQLNNISIHFAGRYLFDGVSFTINKKDRIGLIGRNGTGKTTMIRIIAGLESPEEGIITTPNDMTIGYLPQEGAIESDKSIYQETKSALVEIRDLDESIKSLTEELSERSDYESAEYNKLVQKISEANDRYRILGGHSIDAEIEKVLKGLGFPPDEFGRPVSQFSGGWQMRVELAKILLRRPSCILLDEPTNHLDIESIQWVENFLMNYEGAVVLVSHDRNFLDNVTNRTIEISGGKVYDMPLKFSEFIKARDEIRKQQESAYKNQQRQIEQTERFIERFRFKNTLATRVQSKIKQLEKMDRIELEEEDTSAIKLKFPEPPRSGRVVIEAKSLSKSYGSKLVLDKIDFAAERGERIAFVGKNGEGKSTLTKIFAGMEDYDGELIKGHNAVIGYFAQHQAELMDQEDTVFEVIDKAATGEMRTKVRTLLGAFLFSGESILKKVKVLSGGEKSRLALAKMLLEPVNLLLLDEPTNHLDMAAKDVLKNALADYQGTLIIVSHDRSFLHELTNRTVYFSGRKIKEYPGDIYEFLEKHKIESLQELEKNKSQKQINRATSPQTAKIEREQKKIFLRDKGRLEKIIDKLEKEIENTEQQIAALENDFADPALFEDVDNLKVKQEEFNRLKEELASKTDEWAERQEELEMLEEDFNGNSGN